MSAFGIPDAPVESALTLEARLDAFRIAIAQAQVPREIYEMETSNAARTVRRMGGHAALHDMLTAQLAVLHRQYPPPHPRPAGPGHALLSETLRAQGE